MALNPEAIAAAVKAEIQRQQESVVYEDLSVDQLNDVVAQLSTKLDLCKEAMTKKSGGGAAKKAAAASGQSFPELPWGRKFRRRASHTRPCEPGWRYREFEGAPRSQPGPSQIPASRHSSVLLGSLGRALAALRLRSCCSAASPRWSFGLSSMTDSTRFLSTRL